jgi:hypothetical protein
MQNGNANGPRHLQHEQESKEPKEAVSRHGRTESNGSSVFGAIPIGIAICAEHTWIALARTASRISFDGITLTLLEIRA